MAPRLRTACFSVLLFALAASTRAETGAECTNGLDDDADGLIDCEDPGCGADAGVGPLTLRVDRVGPAGEFDLSWSGRDPGTTMDVASGELSSLAESLAGCEFDSVLGGAELRGNGLGDASARGGSWWFLARAQTPCVDGSYGRASDGGERVVTPGCRPGDALAGCDGAPTPGIVSAWTECDTRRYADEVVVHLTNLTEGTVYWRYSACVWRPNVDILLGGSLWTPVEICYLCGNGHVEWRELGPGEDLVTNLGGWPECMWQDAAYRARFLIADSCPVDERGDPRDCPDTREVVTAPFVIGP